MSSEPKKGSSPKEGIVLKSVEAVAPSGVSGFLHRELDEIISSVGTSSSTSLGNTRQALRQLDEFWRAALDKA